MSLKSALIYFRAREYVLWSLSNTAWMGIEFLLIYNQLGPSKKEIIAKKSNFQRKIWTNTETNSEPKSQKLRVNFYFWVSIFFLLCGAFIHPRQPPKSFGPFGPPWKCSKIHVFSHLSLFLAFLAIVDPSKKIPVIP